MSSSPPASGLSPLPSPPGLEPEAAPRFWRFERFLVLAVVLTNLAAVQLAWFSLAEGRQRAEELATLSTRNLVQVLDHSLSGVGRTIDVTLRAIVEEIERSVRTGHLPPPDEVLALLARYKAWLPETETLRVFDGDGRSLRGAQAAAGSEVSEAGRDYFKRLAGESEPGMVVSRPYFDRSTGKWVVSFARRLGLPDGRFGGVVAATVSVDYMAEMLARPDLGPGGMAMLSYEDLGLISVHPPLAGGLKEISNAAISDELRQLLGAGGGAGSHQPRRMLDGVERINSVRRVEGLPFMLVVGMASENYLVAWHRDVAHTGALLLVFVLTSIGSAMLVSRYYRRQQVHAARLREALADLRDRDQALGITERIGGLGVFSIDLRTGLSHRSAQLMEIFGAAPEKGFPLDAWRAGLHPDDRVETLARFDEGTLHGGRAFDHVYRFIRPDGEVRWIHGLAGAERDASGAPVRIHGAVQDVTDRRQAEASLKEAFEEYERLVASIPVGVFKLHWCPAGGSRFEYVSPRFCEQLGLDAATVLADPRVPYRQILKDDRASFRQAQARVERSLNSFEWEGRIRIHDRIRWISAIARPSLQPDGSVIWEGVQSDVTDRKIAEIALRESEEHYRLLLQHSPVGIVKYDTRLKVNYCNQQFAQIMTAPLDYMRQLDCSTLRDTRVVPALRDAIAGRVGRYEGPYQTTYDGHNLNIAMNCAPLRDEAGQIIGGIAILEDITERLLKDRELARYRDSLEELVAERLARVKSEFLANMSHEIRTPLNGVLGLAHIGFRESRGRDRARDTFTRILSSGQLLLGIINDILDFSKIEAGKLRIEAIPVDLAKVVGDTLDLMEERAQAKGLALRFRRVSALPESCITDPLRVGQVLLNLLSNAIKFTEQGSVTLAVGREGEHLVFEVSDTGIGMSEEEVAKVFAPFEQADNSTTRKFGGTGLGLTITHRIVELMGGTLRAHSRLGEGSCFEVRLPCVVVDAVAVQHSLAGPEALPGIDGARLAGLRVLVAEDNDVNQMVLEELLVSEGAKVVLTGNGQEAVDCLHAQGPQAFDVVLMDVQMPLMDGYAATRAILALAPHLPVIGQTAHAFDEERARCAEAGMIDHLAKPIDPEEMVRVILRHTTGRLPAGLPG
ncbi:MAG: ATP-binding protein [Zoogloea sp.]|uniref:ATP-binding protein n=1 Tax=Zoogloea sp. TaxID=49181 RepID=UPI00261FFA04|nr:ATP-binding protein [Zoogloea sp.]MDD2987757.1 ATP-binding protein [Zoogloea sp.]